MQQGTRATGSWGRVVLGATVALMVVAGWSGAAEARSGHPYFSDRGTLDWTTSFDTAKARARAQGKVIFVEVSNPGCPNCELLCNSTLPHTKVKARMQAAAIGLAADSYGLDRRLRRLFLRNVDKSALRMLPWVAFLKADGTWITGWGGYTSTSMLSERLARAEATRNTARRRTSPMMPAPIRRVPTTPAPIVKPADKPIAKATGPQAGAVPPAPDATPAPDTGRKLLLSSKSGEGTCLGGNCGPIPGGCEGGACEAPICKDGSCEAPGEILAPVIPWMKGKLPAAPQTKPGRAMASRSDALHAVGSPDAETVPDAPPAGPVAMLPPPSVRRVELPPTVPYHPSCDAGALLTGDPDAEIVVRAQPLPTPPAAVSPPVAVAPGPEAPLARATTPSNEGPVRHLDDAVAAAKQGKVREAERHLDAAMRAVRTARMSGQDLAPALEEDARVGRDALKDWREIELMPDSSQVRKHVVTMSRTRYRGTRWAALFP